MSDLIIRFQSQPEGIFLNNKGNINGNVDKEELIMKKKCNSVGNPKH